MPRSKRSKLVSLTQVTKKNKEQKSALIRELQENAEKWRYCWLFEVGSMRNTHLKTVRKLWKDSARIFFGRGAVMAKALGLTPEEEYRTGINELAKQIKGQVGLLFTDSPPEEVIDWFADFKQPDYARAGNIASRTVILPTGPVLRHHSDPPEPFPHNEEPQLRKLGLTTSMNKGVPTLTNPHELCKKGKPLTGEQAQLLKLIGHRLVVFRVGLIARWDSQTGEVVQTDRPGVLTPEDGDGDENAMTYLGLTTQIPFEIPSPTQSMSASKEFSFKEGPGIFSPKNLVELRRPGAGVANQAGDLVLVPISEYSFDDKKNKKSLIVSPIESSAKPLEIQLEKGGEAFWIQSRTIAHVVEGEVGLEIYALDVALETSSRGDTDVLTATNTPVLIAKLPNKSATNFRYSIESRVLVFSDYVYSDGNLTSVAEQDDAYESRGNSAYVYDATYERHWDTWVGPKKSSLFSVSLYQDADRKWVFDGQFTNLLQGTKHSSPVEPFGGADDFHISHDWVVYTTLDPQLNNAWHTKQNIYIVNIKDINKRQELTSGKQGATHSPVFNPQGTKVAWLELDEDGYESDRAKIVIYDLEKDVRFTLTQDWDRSPGSLAFSKEGNLIFFTAGDEAKVKVFVLPVPPTPAESTTHPTLSKKYITPVALTDRKAASGIQPLFYGRLLFSQSSFTSPNDVFIIRDLQVLEASILQSEASVRFNGKVEQITHLTEAALQHMHLDSGESFWFKGALDKDVQGWILKPRGWKAGETKKWPVVLLIHGGPQGAWEDQWSTRWNPNVFAQQGYFVILINPTGSTTFGQEFTDAIAEDWGGKPFVDLQMGWKYVLKTYPEIDADRAVAAGASWGGYAINWIQGHPEYGFGFKALVCHDGVFDSNYNGYSTDELFFFNHEWGGRPWENKSEALSKKYSPSNFVNNWTTPQLLIHGSKDYRLPETESIGAFHALQQRGIRSRLVIFPDENHWVLKHGNSLKWHYEVFRWFDEFIGKD